MEFLVWIGALVSMIGLGGIVWSIGAVARARLRGLDDAALRARIREVLRWNLGALFLSVLGLMLIVVGIVLS